jgi:hypothetical protein
MIFQDEHVNLSKAQPLPSATARISIGWDMSQNAAAAITTDNTAQTIKTRVGRTSSAAAMA